MKNKFKNVKSVRFDVVFEGNGCVNRDSSEQRFVLRKREIAYANNDNVVLAKKMFPATGGFKYKVSSECLKNAMYRKDMMFHNPSIMCLPHVLCRASSTMAMVERGYMFATELGTVKKKGIFGITDAVETGPVRTELNVEVHTRSGYKDTEDKHGVMKDNTLFYKDDPGQCEYKSYGFIDLTEAQFISADMTYDRQAVIPAEEGGCQNIYLDGLKESFPSLGNVDFGFYHKKDNVMQEEWGERGILLDQKSVSDMTKDVLKRVYNINIERGGSFLRPVSMSIDVIMDGGDTERVEIGSEKDIDGMEFIYTETYVPSDEDRIAANAEKAGMLRERKVESKLEEKKALDERRARREEEKRAKAEAKAKSKQNVSE